GIQRHQVQELGRQVAPHRKPIALRRLEGDRVVVRPGPFREQAGELRRLLLRTLVGQEIRTLSRTCDTAFSAWSARMRVWSSTSATGFFATALRIDAAGYWPSCVSSGPSTA